MKKSNRSSSDNSNETSHDLIWFKQATFSEEALDAGHKSSFSAINSNELASAYVRIRTAER